MLTLPMPLNGEPNGLGRDEQKTSSTVTLTLYREKCAIRNCMGTVLLKPRKKQSAPEIKKTLQISA